MDQPKKEEVKKEPKKQNLVCIKSPFDTYASAYFGWQLAMPEMRPETIYDMITLKSGTVQFQNVVDPKYFLVDSKLNKNWEIELGKNNEIKLAGEDGYYYTITKQGDFMGYKDDKEAPNCNLITNVTISEQINPDEGKEKKVDHGDKLSFKNYWGKYFGYAYTRPTMFSQICDETIFSVVKEKEKKGSLFKLDYSCVTMTTVGTNVDYFEIIESPLKGYYHLISERNGKKIYLGSTPLGEVMCWNENKFRTTYWKVE